MRFGDVRLGDALIRKIRDVQAETCKKERRDMFGHVHRFESDSVCFGELLILCNDLRSRFQWTLIADALYFEQYSFRDLKEFNFNMDLCKTISYK